MAKDLIIGAVDNYNWDQIKYWANSIKKSGFDGHKAVIVYNMNADTVKKLTDEGFMIIGCNEYDAHTGFTHDNSRGSIMVDRFFHISSFMSMLAEPMDIDRVIVTDVRDVVFQNNPSKWLDDYFLPNYNLVVGSENLTYSNEPWGKNNINKAFGQYFYDNKKDSEIYCAGVIAGKLKSVRDFCLNIWLVCRGLNPNVEGGGGPDQAAMNIMLDFESYLYTTLRTNPANGFILHAGTSMPAIEAGSGTVGQSYVSDPNKKVDFVHDMNYSIKDECIYVFDKQVSILHQWDRVPAWKTLVKKRFGD